MKNILTLISILSFLYLSQAFADGFQLEEGPYLLITNQSGEIQLRECEITNTKDGDLIKFIYKVTDPELQMSPSKIYYLGHDQLQFTLDVSNYPNPNALKKIAAGTNLYVGSLHDNQISGIYTSVLGAGEPTTSKFVLYKK